MSEADYRLLEKDIEHLKELYGQRFEQLADNLKLQAKEYERRLDDLNGEAGRIKKVQEDSVPREVFDKTMQLTSEKRENEINEIRKTFETDITTLTQKIEALDKNSGERREAIKKTLEERFEASINHIQEMASNNLKSETERFRAVDTQMKVQIDTNAEISNRRIDEGNKAIDEINKKMQTTDGARAVINRQVAWLMSIVAALIIAFLLALFGKYF